MDRCLVLDGGRPWPSRSRPGSGAGSGGVGGRPRAPTLVALARGCRDRPGGCLRRGGDRGGARGATPPAARARSPDADRDGAQAASGTRPRPAPVRVAIDGLVHRYPSGVEAVRGVSLEIEPGEAVAIVGQNGSGKTTLVKHLNGLLRPAAGDVLLDGASAADALDRRLAATVGFVFQNPDDQLFERTVEREVRSGRATSGPEAADRGARRRGGARRVGLPAERTTNPYDLTSRAAS